MHLFQLLIPRVDVQAREYPADAYARIRDELLEQFGGVTAFVQSPATGLWKAADGSTVRDEVVIFEVMVERLDNRWWATYRTSLCTRLSQAELVVRAHEIHRL
jgi:hypothetical protein